MSTERWAFYRAIDCQTCGHTHHRQHRARVDMVAHTCSDCPTCDAARVAALEAAARVRAGSLARTHIPADWPGRRADCPRHGLPTIRDDGECHVR